MQVILGALLQRIEGARSWDCVDHHWQEANRFFLRHLKNTAQQLLCSLQDLAGRPI
jgi:hypothetical protein